MNESPKKKKTNFKPTYPANQFLHLNLGCQTTSSLAENLNWKKFDGRVGFLPRFNSALSFRFDLLELLDLNSMRQNTLQIQTAKSNTEWERNETLTSNPR